MVVWGESVTEKLLLAWENKNNKHGSFSPVKRYVWLKLKKIKYRLLQEKKKNLESTKLRVSNKNFSKLQIQGKACGLDQSLKT